MIPPAWPLTDRCLDGGQVYILNDVSLTLTNSRGSRAPRTPDQARRSVPCGTATCTCPSIVLPAVIDDFITMAQTVEVPS